MKDKFEVVIIVMIVAIFLAMSYAIISTAYAHSQIVEPEPQAWTPRAIPKCDKELWLRIKDGC